MSFSSFTRKAALCLGLLAALPAVSLAQSGYIAQGGEYNVAGSLAGDQVFANLSLRSSGGFLVWQDNSTDGAGLGISARRIDSSLSGSLGSFRVNSVGPGDQEKPKAAVLDNGGAAFVWQGGVQGAQQIYARFLSPSNTWVTADVLVNSYTNSHHIDSAITKLSDGNVVVVWSSYDQDGSMQGVYAQRFSPAGAKLGGEFRVNSTTTLNQRTAAVAGLSDGNFVVVWVNEAETSASSYDVSIFGRLFNSGGAALGGEFLVNSFATNNTCANPNVAASATGGFLVAWSQKDMAVKDNGWDVMSRKFSNAGAGAAVRRLNTMQYGDQAGPKVASLNADYLTVWTSMGQDGSFEGAFGQFAHNDGTLAGGEFRANTTVVSKQIHPTVAADGAGHFLVGWSSFVGGVNSFDLFAQRYTVDSQPLSPPAPPFVTALSSYKLSVTWPEIAGLGIANYELFADGSATAITIPSNMWVNAVNYLPASTHTFTLGYVLTDGRHSPVSSPVASGTTWGYDDDFDGLPDDWEALYFGSGPWPSPNADSDGDGVSNRNEFLQGTNPTNAASVLRTRLKHTPQGLYLEWNTQPGLMYQVQSSASMGAWSNLGASRFAAGAVDSIYVGGANAGFYRINRLR